VLETQKLLSLFVITHRLTPSFLNVARGSKLILTGENQTTLENEQQYDYYEKYSPTNFKLGCLKNDV